MDDQPFIEHVDILGLHGRNKLVSVKLSKGLNILYGPNGVGKTTILHILANLLEADLKRFYCITFNNIAVKISTGVTIVISQVTNGEEVTISVKVDERVIWVGPIQSLPNRMAEDELRAALGDRPVYLPAFRTMLEGASNGNNFDPFDDGLSEELEEIKRSEEAGRFGTKRNRPTLSTSPSERIARKTLLCREWFGEFIPVIRYPALKDLTSEIVEELQNAALEVSQFDRQAFLSIFVKVFESAFNTETNQAPLLITESDSSSIEENIQKLKGIFENFVGSNESLFSTPIAYKRLADVLNKPLPKVSEINESLIKKILEIYVQVAEKRQAKVVKTYDVLNRFQTSVNKFLSDKSITLPSRDNRRQPAKTFVLFSDGTRHPLNVLSSGERHLITLIFCATHMSDTDGIVLIDEPELSLHIDWQRIILRELLKQTMDRQVIVCTHASEIAADHRESLVPLSFV